MNTPDKHGLSSAAYARAMGWKVGDIIDGGPIMASGQVTESPRALRITAIGEDLVLGKITLLGKPERPHESSMTWTDRDWTKRE
jgi:hypothetical protein